MAEAKSRREPTATRPRPRTKGDLPPDAADADDLPESDGAPRDEAVATEAPAEPRREPERTFAPPSSADDYAGFDEEINNRYEEIKRGSTHISELQQMTMPQLLRIAREENLSDYTGLKKQDLIFKILRSVSSRTG